MGEFKISRIEVWAWSDTVLVSALQGQYKRGMGVEQKFTTAYPDFKVHKASCPLH